MDTPGSSIANGNGGESSSHNGTGLSLEEWVVQQHQVQQETNARIAASNEEMRTLLRDILQNRQRAAPATQQQVATSEPLVAATAPPTFNIDPRKPRHALGHPDKYDGENKTEYPPFKGLLRAKLRIDHAAIGGETEQVWYAYGRLSGKAAARMFPWLEATDKKGEVLRVDSFIEQMDAAFYDAQLAQRALEWINTHKQKSKPFREFLQEFDQKLLEAGGYVFPDDIKKNYLKAALNIETRKQLIAQKEPVTYNEYVALVRRTSDDMDEVKRLERGRSAWASAYQKKESSARADSMDWEPTPRAAANKQSARKDDKRTPAKWVTMDVLNQRRADGDCLRCGRDDHFIDKCRYGPAKKPARSTSSASSSSSSRRTAKGAGKSSTKGKKPAPLLKVEEVETDSADESVEDVDSENE